MTAYRDSGIDDMTTLAKHCNTPKVRGRYDGRYDDFKKAKLVVDKCYGVSTKVPTGLFVNEKV